MEAKRTILAVVLSMAVLLVFQYLMPARQAPAPQTPATAQQAAGPGGTSDAGTDLGSGVATAPAGAPSGGAALSSAPTEGAPVQTVVLANEVLEVELSTRGAAVTEARLKRYLASRNGAGDDPVRLLTAPGGHEVAGASRLAQSAPQWGVVFEEVERTAQRVVYRWTSPSGLSLEKTYELQPGRYDLSLQVRVYNGTGQPLHDRLGLLLVGDFTGKQDAYTFAGPAYYQDDSLEEVDADDLTEERVDVAGVQWAALVQKYFVVAAVPEGSDPAQLRVGPYLGMEKVAEAELLSPVFDLAAGGEQQWRYGLYLGPKDTDALAPLGASLGELVHYGFFHVIAKPLALFLNAIYSVTGNYGVAIIILTTVIKLLFFPLSARSFRSMQKMKEVQPKMQRLRERYKDDRERLNMEVMQLYKTHKVNPLGGCLPMLVQIPFFFALYRILLSSIELRHAPFFLWIQDLSAKDPYYVTPLLMGASMFLQQKMTPMSGTNESQMKMMMYGMPVVFTFLFLNFPSGLVIYWLVNNLLTIAQQAWQLRERSGQAAAA